MLFSFFFLLLLNGTEVEFSKYVINRKLLWEFSTLKVSSEFEGEMAVE